MGVACREVTPCNERRLAVLGGGSWGTALAILLARQGQDVYLWIRDATLAERVRQTRVNEVYLPGIPLPEQVQVGSDLAKAISECLCLLAVIPTQFIREVARDIVHRVTREHVLLNASKGLEVGSCYRPSQIWVEEIPALKGRLAVLSGPNHAEEVAIGVPSSSVVASAEKGLAESFQELLMGPTFRVYTNPDLVGVEVSGALKNVIAIGAGISDGLGFGDNTKAALITRGLAEIARLGVKLGAQPLTFTGLAGMGDLVATCTSMHSRNRRLGEAIGRGRPLVEALASSRMVVEGVSTTRAALDLARRVGVEMPITQAVYGVLFEGVDPRAAVAELMRRGPRSELDAFLSDGVSYE